MSEMTKCNYCTMQIILAEAKRSGARVITKHSSFGLYGSHGTDVFVVPAGEKMGKYKAPSAKNPNGDKEYQKYHRAWLAEIPYRCEC